MNPARLVMPALRFARVVDEPDASLRLAERGVGGFCVFGGDARLPALLHRLQEAAPHRLLFAADLEEGAGQQIAGCTRHPPCATLDPDAAETAGLRTALEARAHGITMTFAPVCDVASNPDNPIVRQRAFADPARSAPRFVAGAHRGGLRTCAKHFPGHGATTADSHEALPVVDDPEAVWRSRDLPPFAACIAAGVDAVMTAHVACPGLTGSRDLPATLSPRLIDGLLRAELGFDGLVVTDALLMAGVLAGREEQEAARLALAAGCDLLLCPADVEAVLQAAGEAPSEAAQARIAAIAEPLEDPLAASARRSARGVGDLPVAPGPHPLRILDPGAEGADLAREAGLAFERYDGSGDLVEAAPGRGFAVPAVAILRRERAWSGPLALPAPLQALAAGAGLLVVLGHPGSASGLRAPRRIEAPGLDPWTRAAVIRMACRDPSGPGAGPGGPRPRLLS